MIQSVTYYTVACSDCGRWCEESIAFMQDTVEQAMAYARDEGWQAETGKLHLCPTCRRSAA